MMVEIGKIYGFLEGERLYLRAVLPDDANEAYVRHETYVQFIGKM